MSFKIPARYELKKKHLMSKEMCSIKVQETIKQLPWNNFWYNADDKTDKESDEIKDYFDHKTHGTMMTFAERIRIYIGETEILVKSECLFPAQFLDFGKNKKNVNDFFEIFDKL